MEVLALLGAIFIILLVINLIAFIDKLRQRQKIKRRIAFYYGRLREFLYSKDALSAISGYSNSKEKNIDAITWNDLDMDTVFMTINNTWSFAGEDYLYYLLHLPQTSAEAWEQREELIAYFQTHPAERKELQLCFASVGKNHSSSIYLYLQNSLELSSVVPYIHYFALGSLVLSIAFTFLNPVGLYGLPIISMLLNITLYFTKGKEVRYSRDALPYFLRLQKCAGLILKKKLIHQDNFQKKLKSHHDLFRKRLGHTTLLKPPNWDSSSPLEWLTSYFRLITHIDCILFYRTMKKLKLHNDDIENLIATMGELESLIAIGSFREALPYYSIPSFTTENVLHITDAYHPFLSDPVANSVDVHTGALITGSNASGKSTFLKTIAVNVVFAQGLHTCTAHSYHGKWSRLFTSMALTDDLFGGDSYYIAEIKALKRILTQEDPSTVLCFVDEVLRGTNTVERIAASTQVLRTFAQKGILCFAATHDIELTHLLEREYENYHFQETVENDEILFDYILYKGRATSKNAIKLLELLGYDPNLILGAEEMVNMFLETGKWE